MINRTGDAEEEFRNLGFADLGKVLALADDLDDIERALVRERAIRKGMARTGEGREVVAEAIDAMQGMDREAVLDLTEGNPTTLNDALARYIRIVQDWDEVIPRDRVVSDLGAILENPWPAEEERLASHGINQALDLHVENTGSSISVAMGPNRWEVYRAETYGNSAVTDAVQGTAEAVYRAVLSRVIADRDHHVQLDRNQTEHLIGWLDRGMRSGSWVGDTRLSVDAVAGGGILIRTRPYAYQHRVAEEQRNQRRESTDGIRPHRPMRPEDEAAARRYALENAEPIDADQIRRALDNS